MNPSFPVDAGDDEACVAETDPDPGAAEESDDDGSFVCGVVSFRVRISASLSI
jgi:hypothetical protein